MINSRRTKTTGEGWSKVAGERKTYRHDETGTIVKYNCNRFLWGIIGGEHDGEHYGAKWIAMQTACKTPAEFI